MPKQQQLVDIVSSVYDTILNPDAWVLTGQKIRERYHAVYSGLYVYDVRTGGLVHDAIYGIDQSFKDEYKDTYCYIDPYRESEEFMAANPNIALTDKRIEDLFFSIEGNHSQHAYFGEYWHRFECNHVIGTMFDLPGHLRAGICSPRSTSMGAYTTAEKIEFESIRKTFHQAMTLSKHINQLGTDTAALEQTIKFINQGVFIVDDKCRILNTNEAGLKQIKSSSVFTDKNGRLGSTIKDLNAELVNAVSAACNEVICEQASISRKLKKGLIEILICPFQNETNFFKYKQPRAVVFLLQGQVSGCHVLSDIYEFTCSEKIILKLAMQGNSIKQIAKIRGTSPETVKSQIRSIYSKTEVSNIHELRQLVTAVPVLV